MAAGVADDEAVVAGKCGDPVVPESGVAGEAGLDYDCFVRAPGIGEVGVCIIGCLAGWVGYCGHYVAVFGWEGVLRRLLFALFFFF